MMPGHRKGRQPPSYPPSEAGYPDTSGPYVTFPITTGHIPPRGSQRRSQVPSNSALSPANSALYNTEHERPPSPAPSYHTIPPPTHKTLPPNAAAPPPPPTMSGDAVLRRAALETPEAILSHLTISNTSGSATHPITDRTLSAKSHPDGKERYHVTFPDAQTMKVLRGSSTAGGGQRESMVGTVYISPRDGLRVEFWGGDGMETGEKVAYGYEELQETQRLPLDLCVDGRIRRFWWEVVGREQVDAEKESGRHGDATSGLRTDEEFRPAFGIQSQRDKQRQQLSELQLIDAETQKVWASYMHDMRKPSMERSEKWGEVEIKCRAALLDEGVDRALVGLVALVEVYGRLFGSNRQKGGLDGWGVLTGVLFCSVM